MAFRPASALVYRLAMTTILDLAGTKWSGQGELWLDPLGNQADVCDCTIEVAKDAIDYRWSHEGKPHTGRIALRPEGADFTDTFHAPTTMSFVAKAPTWCVVDLFGTYECGGPPWGWRILLSLRPTGELVLQMTNIAPWGEAHRAVRMICKRSGEA